ncbi:OPA3-domain-containing protein [Martensiomyces pterosporus]|nr:OPA3-domain-containing protein [Martensiomyces pterosporus]
MSQFKIASLLFRTLSKPVANALKQQAKSHEFFRSLCINVAQLAHRTEMNWKMKVLGYKKEKIRPLNDARAVDAGANFLGEAFIFGVAVSLIFAEQLRSRNQAQRQRNAVDDRLDSLEKDIVEQGEAMSKLREERDLLRLEFEELAQETLALSSILMQVLGKDMEKWGIDHGHTPTKISKALIERFDNGEDIDSSLRDAIKESRAPANEG